MNRQTVEAVVDWQKRLDEGDALDVTFHGGEPLTAGIEYYRMALPLLRDRLSSRQINFSMQSNLWLLTDELTDLFRDYSVSIGTSLDGPEKINDAQRGKGYFKLTMAGIERARNSGIPVGCICTFTKQSAENAEEIFNFFVKEGLSFSIHAALPSVRHSDTSDRTLSSEKHGRLLVQLLDLYLGNLDKVRISTLDSLCRSVSAQKGGICIFCDCLGNYPAVGPDGELYPCQRFTGLPQFRVGNVNDRGSLEQISSTPAWITLKERESRIKEECADCPHIDICRGGCPYNAMAGNGGKFSGALRDPLCGSYKRIFDYIRDKALEEVFSEENMREVVSHPDKRAGLIRKGQILAIMKDGPHPYETAQNAKKIIASIALAATNSSAEVTEIFRRLGITVRSPQTENALRLLYQGLSSSARSLNNLYLHVTYACNLHCAHCYAVSGPDRQETLDVEHIKRICVEAGALNFRQVVITGGEPLCHPLREELLNALAALRVKIRPTRIVLRTNLAMPLDDKMLRRIGQSAGEVVVSVDGNKETHDTRRGAGNYERTERNLRRLAGLGCTAEISLAAVLTYDRVDGKPGDSLRVLAEELGIKKIRFRPLLPLGRAVETGLETVPGNNWGHKDPLETVAGAFNPVSSCGLGQNLYIAPDGAAFPCYAVKGEKWLLGNVNSAPGLAGIIDSSGFAELKLYSVDNNKKCKLCLLRYLCGGACRAWSIHGNVGNGDLDSPSLDCGALHERARSLLLSALDRLEIPLERWLGAGLSLPDSPPSLI